MPDQPTAPPPRPAPQVSGSVSGGRDPTIKDLLKKLVGRKVALSTRCGTFRETVGVVKEVFEEFILFLTVDERAMDQTPMRHWILIRNLGVISEEPRVTAEELPIARYEI